LLAAIAQKHLLSNILDKNHKPQTWEERIVYLADKLVEGSQIVSFEERLSALKQRYGIGSQYDIPLREMQEDICSKLGISPPQLVDIIRNAIYSGRTFNGRP
jgi:putative hydrolase of the HAD superfamily